MCAYFTSARAYERKLCVRLFVHAHVYVLFNEKEREGVFVKVGMHILSLKGADAITIH